MDSGKERRPIGGQLIIPIAGLIFTLYYFSTIIDSPFEAQVAAFFVGTILTVLSLVFVVRCVIAVRAGEADFGLGDLIGQGFQRIRRLGLFALTLGYVVVIPYLGFTLTTFAFLAAAMILLDHGARPQQKILLAAALALAGYLLFVVAFETRFPEGPFETLMEGLLP